MGMEDETRAFFIRIANSVALLVLWMLVGVFAGIYFKLAFFKGWPAPGNIIFYIIFLVSLYFILKHLKKKWQL